MLSYAAVLKEVRTLYLQIAFITVQTYKQLHMTDISEFVAEKAVQKWKWKEGNDRSTLERLKMVSSLFTSCFSNVEDFTTTGFKNRPKHQNRNLYQPEFHCHRFSSQNRLDSALKPTIQADAAVTKACCSLAFIWRIGEWLALDVFLPAYSAPQRPVHEYCVEVWPKWWQFGNGARSCYKNGHGPPKTFLQRPFSSAYTIQRKRLQAELKAKPSSSPTPFLVSSLCRPSETLHPALENRIHKSIRQQSLTVRPSVFTQLFCFHRYPKTTSFLILGNIGQWLSSPQ